MSAAVKQVAVKESPRNVLAITTDELLQHKLSRMLPNDRCHLNFRKPTERRPRDLSHLPQADVVLLDITSSLEGFLHSLTSLKKRQPTTQVVLLVPPSEMYFWIEAIHAGAWECLPRTIQEADLKAVLLKLVNA